MSYLYQLREDGIVYPESDGRRVGESTQQFYYIATIQGGIDSLFAHDPNVFVAGNLTWYPVRGDRSIRRAPDIFVAFGRPKGPRGAYLQWKEDNVAPQVVFEILSPSNFRPEMRKKFEFYQQYGVEEYYVYNAERGRLTGYLRQGAALNPLQTVQGWISPRLGLRFELADSQLELYRPDGRRVESYVALYRNLDRAETERERAERLAAKLRALGVDPDTLDEEVA
jgi:hypothetical protein